MTIILAVDWLDELHVISDTRISYPQPGIPLSQVRYDKDTGICKTYVLSMREGKPIMFSFCGFVDVARKVYLYLWFEKFRHLQRRINLPDLQENIRVWISEALEKHKIDLESAMGTQFLIASLGTEQMRTLQNPKTKKRIGSLPWPASYRIIYFVSESGKVKTMPGDPITILGSGKSQSGAIIKSINSISGTYRDLPNGSELRVRLIATVLNNIIFSDANDVGGAFQIYSMLSQGRKTRFLWQAANTSLNSCHVEDDTVRFLSDDPKLNFRILPIWHQDVLPLLRDSTNLMM